MSGYPIETVSRPYRYKKTKKQTKTVEADREKEEKKESRAKNVSAAPHVTPSGADTSQGFRMKASGLLSRQRAWQIRFPEKRRAHEAVRQALLKGVLVKQPCADCGTTHNVDGHHEDYSQPLVVTWLCRKHHAARHRKPILKRAG